MAQKLVTLKFTLRALHPLFGAKDAFAKLLPGELAKVQRALKSRGFKEYILETLRDASEGVPLKPLSVKSVCHDVGEGAVKVEALIGGVLDSKKKAAFAKEVNKVLGYNRSSAGGYWDTGLEIPVLVNQRREVIDRLPPGAKTVEAVKQITIKRGVRGWGMLGAFGLRPKTIESKKTVKIVVFGDKQVRSDPIQSR